jgi:polar amino acid transport system substrate-binding protein
MKKFFLTTILLLSTALSYANDSKIEKVILTTGEWPPFQGKELMEQGISNYIATMAFKKVGIKIKNEFYPWARSMELAKKDKYHGTLVWSPNSERKKHFIYSDPLLGKKYSFISLKETLFRWTSLKNLVGSKYKIGLNNSYHYGKDFDEYWKKGKLNISELPREELIIKMLLKKRINVGLFEPIAFYAQLKKIAPEKKDDFVVHPKSVHISAYHLLLNKKNKGSKELIKLFNKGLKEVKEEIGEDRIMYPCNTPIDDDKRLTKYQKKLFTKLCDL